MKQSSPLPPHKRLHVYLNPKNLSDAASFIVGSLALSHSIRRDTIAVVALRKAVIAAPGSTIRQLRPDLESATGWLRAVLRGKHRGLGALLLDEPPLPRGEALEIAIIGGVSGARRGLCRLARFIGEGAIRGLGRDARVSLYYYRVGDDTIAPQRVAGRVETWLPPAYAAATANIVLDRLEAGLPACP